MTIEKDFDGAYASHWSMGVVGQGDIFGGERCV
jgi:hypothetical protein